jgi:integrase/recombinase XerD
MTHATALPSALKAVGEFELAVADFLGFFRENTRAAYEYDLAIFVAWCAAVGLDPLTITRLQIEAFIEHCETVRGNGFRTIHRRVSTIKRFYRLIADDGIIARSPAEMVRIRKTYTPPTTEADLGLDRAEFAALLQVAKAGRPVDAALVALLGMMGLRVSEACGLTVPDVHLSAQGHRVVKFVGKGGKPATAPIAIPVARLIDAACNGRDLGPVLLRPNTGTGMDRIAAYRTVVRLGIAAGIERHVTPHDLRRAYVSGLLDAGVSLRDAQTAARHADPRMTMHYDRRRHSLDRHGNYQLAAWIASSM